MLDEVCSETPFEGMTRADFLKVAGATGLVVTASGTVLSVVGSTAHAQDETEGEFGPLFVEPWIYFPKYYNKDYPKGPTRVRTNAECVPPPERPEQNRRFCKPAAGQNALVPNGGFLYINAIEGSEDSEGFAIDADKAAEDSQSRVIKINYSDNTKSVFIKPKRNTGVSPPEEASELIPGTPLNDRGGNDGDMFCSHQCHLPGGSLLVVGGTNWYNEPGVGGPGGTGAIELEGNSRSRFYDWRKNNWFRTGDLNYGRWYPTVVPSADGTPYCFGGVHKLEKPIYLPPQEPGEPPFYDSGGNVRFVEKLRLETGKWKLVGGPEKPDNTARRSLPLQSRIHLLPNGHFAFNGCGQAWSPNGQDTQQARWNISTSFDPEAETWTDHGVAGEGCLKPFNVGSKLSTPSVPLLMEPDEDGNYTTMVILNGGGTHSLGALTAPGSYFPNNQSRISTWMVELDGPVTSVTHADTGDMFNAVESETTNGQPPEAGGVPLGRWYGDGALLPSGEVFISSGGDRDEVVFPGIEFPIIECEIFNPNDTSDSPNGSWREVGAQTNPRTYHNSNCLLPSGEVIIGGHSPIAFGYVSHDSDVVPGSRNSDSRDPTFQIYSPTYVANPNRPEIDYTGIGKHGTKEALLAKTGGNLVIPTSDGADIDDVAIIRLGSVTHVNNSEQRGLVLPVTATDGNSVTAKMPGTLGELGGPGFYLAFIRADGGALPSEGVFVHVRK